MDLQGMMDGINKMNREVRSRYHLTLGQAISMLSKLPQDTSVIYDFNNKSPKGPHSFRGHYSDLAFEWSGDEVTIRDFVSELNASWGKTFTGYKGGDFIMDAETPLWAAEYGECGRAIIGILKHKNEIILTTKEIE